VIPFTGTFVGDAFVVDDLDAPFYGDTDIPLLFYVVAPLR